MKKPVLSVVFFFIILPMLAQHDKNCEMYPSMVDSIYVYDKNTGPESWKLNTILLYQNSEDKHTRLTFINGLDRKPIRASDYYYDPNGNRDLELQYYWSTNTWNEYIRIESEFTENNKKLSESRTILRQETWTLSAYYYFEYPENDIVKIHYQIKDDEGNLFDKRITEQLYRDKKPVETRIYDGISGSLIELNYYHYNNDNGKLNEFIILTPDPITDEMKEFRRRVYYYDEYLLLREVIFEEMKNNEWAPFSKYEYFYKIDHAQKVIICHNGHTICISASALKTHLKQGDHLGECKSIEEKHMPDKQMSDKNEIHRPFILFPNPASDMFTIRFQSPKDHGYNRVELSDSYGRILKSAEIGQAPEVSLFRGDLKKGSYFVRIIGKETISTMVLFE